MTTPRDPDWQLALTDHLLDNVESGTGRQDAGIADLGATISTTLDDLLDVNAGLSSILSPDSDQDLVDLDPSDLDTSIPDEKNHLDTRKRTGRGRRPPRKLRRRDIRPVLSRRRTG